MMEPDFNPRDFLTVEERELWDDPELCVATIEELLRELARERVKLRQIEIIANAGYCGGREDAAILAIRELFGDCTYDPAEIQRRGETPT